MKQLLLIWSILFISFCSLTQNTYYTSEVTSTEIEGGCALYLKNQELQVDIVYSDEGVMQVNNDMDDLIVFYNEGLNCKINPKYDNKKFYVLTKKSTKEVYDFDSDSNIEIEVIQLVALYPVN